MMSPIHNAWAVAAVPVHEDSPPSPLPPTKRRKLAAELADARDRGATVQMDPGLVLALLAAAEPGPVIGYEAVIEDAERGIVYRAQVDGRGDLGHLEVSIGPEWIDDNALRRIPVGRIRATALAHIAEAQRQAAVVGLFDDALVLTLPGGLAERPTLDEVAQLMSEGRTRAEIRALYPSVPLPTIGRWMSKVRKSHQGSQTPDAILRRTEKGNR